MEQQEIKTSKEFGLSNLALNNSTSVFILVAIIVLFGLFSYISMPKEQYPEVKLPTVYVNTVYPGNSPVDIENLITRHIEKELKSMKGVKEISSTSVQDVSAIVIEFNEDVEVSKAVQDTKDAVDKAKSELPTDLDEDPSVVELDFSELPILIINMSGDFEIDKLNDYAEYLEDKIEALTEVSKVEISGSIEKEVQVNVDLYKIEAMQVSFNDIANAISGENVTMSGGDILTNGFRRSLRVFGEFQDVKEMENIIVKAEDNENVIFLKDVAEVVDSYIERDSYARMATNDFNTKGSKPVITLSVMKRSGENLIEAAAKVDELLAEAQESYLPDNLDIIITQAQADDMKRSIDNLENSIISGVILVVVVLLFFMGLRNAMFVGIAIPLSMFMSFLVLSGLGVTINIVVLFGLILALGMLVDNAIVVIENIYRLMEEGHSPLKAAKEGVGEVAMPIISSTATTLAAFVPLAFWGGIMGEFMKYLPITLIIVLASSLFVGLVVNPVVASTFMQVQKGSSQESTRKKRLTIVGIALIVFSIPSYFAFETYSLANLLMLLGILTLLNAFAIRPVAYWFQHNLLVRLEKIYLVTLRYALGGIRPYFFFVGTFVFLIATVMFLGASQPKVGLFPENKPNYIYMYIEAPLGTDVETTNERTAKLEKRLHELMVPYKSIIESIIVNVGKNTNDPQEGQSSNITPHKAKISVSFIPFEQRGDFDTGEIMKEVSEMAKEFPGLAITTAKESNGPPVGAPISIEITGEDYVTLIKEAEKIKAKIDQSSIAGIDGLKMDVRTGKPELLVNIDRGKAVRYGVSTGMVADNLRTAIYGKEVSKFKDGDDDYPIQVRLKDKYRYDISTLNDMRLTFRDNKGKMHQVPVSAIADLEYSSTYGEVKRKDLDKVITINSNVIEGYNANEIVNEIKTLLSTHKMKEGYAFKFGGEQEEQAKSFAFLANALLIAVCAIFLILVSQFNSAIKPFIIVGSVIFSMIGVFLGIALTGDDFIIIMTGIGIISLAGVVVNNAIVLIDYIDLTRKRKRKELDIPEGVHLPTRVFIECLIQGGYTRLRPVLLTAITTVLGLIPLATGLNIDFFGLFATFEPAIYVGGDNADFWGPMAWTVIYGLVFATFLTLVIVPVMYLISDNMLQAVSRMSGKPQHHEEKVG